MSSEVKVGIAVILGIVVIVLGTIWLQGWQIGQHEREVTAWFREIGQLQTGNAVKLRGVPIGRVSAIELDRRSAGVFVRMDIDAELTLPEEPVVILSPESLFGSWQAEIYPRSRFPIYAYSVPPEAELLPGYSLPDVSRLTAVADRIAENLAVITDRIDIAFTDETALAIRQAIENIQEVTGRLTGLVQAQEQTVRDVAAGLETTTATLSEAAQTAQRAFAQIEAAIDEGELASIVDNIHNVSVQLDSLTRALTVVAGDVSGAATSAGEAFSSFNAIMADLEAGEGSLGRLLQDTALYDDLVLTTTLVQDLLMDFQRNPRRYINLRIF